MCVCVGGRGVRERGMEDAYEELEYKGRWVFGRELGGGWVREGGEAEEVKRIALIPFNAHHTFQRSKRRQKN